MFPDCWKFIWNFNCVYFIGTPRNRIDNRSDTQLKISSIELYKIATPSYHSGIFEISIAFTTKFFFVSPQKSESSGWYTALLNSMTLIKVENRWFFHLLEFCIWAGFAFRNFIMTVMLRKTWNKTFSRILHHN